MHGPRPTSGRLPGVTGAISVSSTVTLAVPSPDGIIIMMPWLLLLLALASLALAFKASTPGVLALWLLVALGLLVAWILGLLSQRVGNASRDASYILDPDELRRMREQAEARKLASQNTPESEH
nr:hypothetical protein [Lysobacter alkalisoli]